MPMDYFNKSERIKQKQFAKWRDEFFSSVIVWLVTRNISQNKISILGVIFLKIACIIKPAYYFLIAFFMAGYFFCDAIDGGIARYKNEQSRTGSLIDIICDQLGVVFISAAFIHNYDINAELCLIFSNFYIAFIMLIVFLNEKNISVFQFIRVKYILFMFYIFSSLIPLLVVNYFLLIFSIYYIVNFVIALNVMIKNKDMI